MVPYLGDFAEDETVYHYFNTFSSDDPSASVTITNLIASDIYVYKDGSTTDLTTDGASVAVDFDSRTGVHKIEIDTSAHADYSTGSEYMVLIEGTTVDGGTITAAVFTFSIERTNGALAVVNRIETDTQDLQTQIGTDGAGLTNLPGVTLAAGAITNASLAGNMEIVFETDFATNYNTTRNAWATNAQDFVGTSASDPFNGQVVAASVTGAVGSVTGAVGSVTGSVGSVTGAVGSVTAGVSLAAGAIDNASLGGNMEIVYETDFATNYNTTRNAWATNTQDTVGTGSFDTATGFSTHSAANVRTEMDSNSTQLAAIVADTNELQTDDVPGLIAALNNLSAADVNTQVDTAITDAHLDHLIAAQGTSDSGTTTTVVDAARTEADDIWNGSIIFFPSTGESSVITDFVASTDTITFTPAVQTAITTEEYVILPASNGVIEVDSNGYVTVGTVSTAANASIADAVWDEDVVAGHNTADTAGDKIGDMTYTNANELDVNTKSINDAEVVGDGNATPWDGA